MIEEPPLLTIRARRNRPSAARIAALAEQPLGFLTDSMDGLGALPAEIKPLAPDVLPMRICGPALTCACGPGDILALLAALTEIEPGDVLVVSTGAWRGCAVTGDRVAGMARNGGAVGLVTDGLARDYDGIVAAGLPLYCAGLSPNSPYGKGPGTVGEPVSLGGVRVCTGDLVVADRDGVVIVPFERIDQTIETVAKVRALELSLDAEVAAGLKVPANIAELVASSQVRRL